MKKSINLFQVVKHRLYETNLQQVILLETFCLLTDFCSGPHKPMINNTQIVSIL